MFAVLLVFIGSQGQLVLPNFSSNDVEAAPGDGHMLLFWDGGAAPTDWTCVSCTSGDPFFEIFPRGNSTYGGTGGAATHSHTTSNSISGASGAVTTNNTAGTVISDFSHAHSVSVTVGSASNLPQYRQLQIIRHDFAGEPTTIPAGAIGLFDDTLPAGWNSYSAQNGNYPRGGASVATGGSNTHNHSLSITIGGATGLTYGVANGGTRGDGANAGHTHTASGNSSTVNNEPPYIETIFGQIASDDVPPDGLLAMWDDEVPVNWSSVSENTGAFHQRFFKAAATYGATSGATTHGHVNTTVTTSAPNGFTNARATGTLVTASSVHTHDVTVANYSIENQLPPYRDVIVGKKVPEVDVSQGSYRFYRNADSTAVGTPLGSQNTPSAAPNQGTPFRMRVLLPVDSASLGVGDKNFKLQYAERSGTCDVAFSGESYSDVSTSSGTIRYYDNGSPSNGAALTPNANDPTSANTIIDQSYGESNNFTTLSTVADGEEGLWDFALVDNSAPLSTNYCFRVVYDDGSLLNSYASIPEIITSDGNGHMLLMYDGGTVPSGWSCVSCDPADDFYQRFFRGATSYGGKGGSATHGHTGSFSVGTGNGNTSETNAGSATAISTHTHTASLTIASGQNLPPYRQLKIIRADASGVPSSLPAGVIAMFDNTLPTGWTQYSAQNGSYIRGEDTVGTTGGSLTHVHSITGSLNDSVGTSTARTSGGTQQTALPSHTHTVSGNSTSANHEPPFIEAILAKIDATGTVPQGLIAAWDGPMPGTWDNVSDTGQPFENRFVKPAATYGTTGGSATHSHTDTIITSSAPNITDLRRTGTGSSSGAHTHDVTISAFSTESNLPPYTDVLIGKLSVPNTPPNNPANLNQERTSDSSTIAVGDYTNGGQVRFAADASDSDNPDDLQLCVEVVPIASSFTGSPTQCGSLVTYSGTDVEVTVTISGFVSGTSYHWRAQIKDGSGGVSSWVSFGGNSDGLADFIDDSTPPSGTVYDGTTVSVDVDFNDGSLDELAANWSITDGQSGLDYFEFAIGTTSGGNDVVDWSNLALVTSYTASSLNLETSDVYFVSIRAFDNAGNDSVTTSDGQQVAPSLSFSTSSGDVVFENLNAGNNFSATDTTVVTTSTNARNGYVVRTYATGLLESVLTDTIPMFDGGTYASPDEWLLGDRGYGYTSSDTLVQGINKFSPVSCAGGGSPPCYAPFSQSVPGDIVADNTGPVSGSPIVNESFTVTHRVAVDSLQNPGRYETVVIFSATATY